MLSAHKHMVVKVPANGAIAAIADCDMTSEVPYC